MKRIFCKFEHEADETSRQENFYTEIDEKTPEDIVKQWLMPGYWTKAELINPIIYREENRIRVITGFYTLPDNIMIENDLQYKYRYNEITIYPENDPALGNLGVLTGGAFTTELLN